MMDCADADMVETDSPATASGGGEEARSFLPYARQLIDEGKPSQALQMVVMALKNIGGDEAVLQALNRARQLHTAIVLHFVFKSRNNSSP